MLSVPVAFPFFKLLRDLRISALVIDPVLICNRSSGSSCGASCGGGRLSTSWKSSFHLANWSSMWVCVGEQFTLLVSHWPAVGVAPTSTEESGRGIKSLLISFSGCFFCLVRDVSYVCSFVDSQLLLDVFCHCAVLC